MRDGGEGVAGGGDGHARRQAARRLAGVVVALADAAGPMAVSALRTSLLATASRPWSVWRSRLGRAIAARTPTSRMTTSSSGNEKPCSDRRLRVGWA